MTSAAAILCVHVASQGLPILLAARSAPIREEDSGWQFLCNSGATEDQRQALVWSLQEVLELEPSLTDLMASPPGTQLTREHKGVPWRKVVVQ